MSLSVLNNDLYFIKQLIIIIKKINNYSTTSCKFFNTSTSGYIFLNNS